MLGAWVEKLRKWREDNQDTRIWWRVVIVLPFVVGRLYFTDRSTAIFLTVILVAGGIAAFLIRRR